MKTMHDFNAWFHGLDLALLKPASGKPSTLGQYAYGPAGVAAMSFVTGTQFAFVYNRVAPRLGAP